MSSPWSSSAPQSSVEYVDETSTAEAARQWTDSYKSLSLWISAVYVILIYSGQKWMHTRPRFQLQTSLFCWSFVLALFSIFGAFFTVPELYNGIVHHGWTYSLCDTSFYFGSTGFWAFAFVMSKVFELGDTAFIIFRGQPLIFLHYYHHFTVLIYSVYSYSEHVSSARWYIVMNYCVHSVMYSYYAVRAAHIWVPSFMRMTITTMQMVQMIIGLIVSISVFVIKLDGTDCHQSYYNAGGAVLMYGSYLVLFANFFYQQYVVLPKKKSSRSSPGNKLSDFSEGHEKKLH